MNKAKGILESKKIQGLKDAVASYASMSKLSTCEANKKLVDALKRRRSRGQKGTMKCSSTLQFSSS